MRRRVGRNIRFLLSVLRMRFITHRPIFLTHMITSLCDCQCLICHYWKFQKIKEMTTSQIHHMLDDAWNVGITDYVVWGGEPLLRKDLSEVLAYANQRGLDNTLITNGNLLPERIDEFAQNLHRLIVSIDHPEAEAHDKLRRKKGVFSKAIKGIERARRDKDLNILINCVIQKGNINRLEDMAELAREQGVKITFGMIELVKDYNEQLVPDHREIKTAASTLIQLKKSGFPIVNSSSYFRALAERREYSCQVPKFLVTVYSDGKVRLCSNIARDATPHSVECKLGNVNEKSFAEILSSRSYGQYVEAAENCWKCNLSYAREIALIETFDLDAMGNLWNFISKIL